MATALSALRSDITTLTRNVNRWTAEEITLAVNTAIGATFPTLYRVNTVVIGTISTDVLDYSISATDVSAEGIFKVQIEQDSGEMYETNTRWWLENDLGTKTLHFAEQPGEAGDDIKVWYRTPHPELSAEADTTDVPRGYIRYAASAELLRIKMMEATVEEARVFANLAERWQAMADRLLAMNFQQPPSHRMRQV